MINKIVGIEAPHAAGSRLPHHINLINPICLPPLRSQQTYFPGVKVPVMSWSMKPGCTRFFT
jgi:hypothetical protein